MINIRWTIHYLKYSRVQDFQKLHLPYDFGFFTFHDETKTILKKRINNTESSIDKQGHICDNFSLIATSLSKEKKNYLLTFFVSRFKYFHFKKYLWIEIFLNTTNLLILVKLTSISSYSKSGFSIIHSIFRTGLNNFFTFTIFFLNLRSQVHRAQTSRIDWNLFCLIIWILITCWFNKSNKVRLFPELDLLHFNIVINFRSI